MKRIIILTIAFLLQTVCMAQVTERIYVITDRDVYISGDDVWCSLFCFDANTASYSDFSAIAYLELLSTDGTACTAKISLLNGRGAGVFRIPAGTPTGNYRLVAYTALNANEKGTDWFAGAKTLSIFNTTGTARVSKGIQIMEEDDYRQFPLPAEEPSPVLSLSITGNGRNKTLNITNNGRTKASIAVSVSKQDEIRPPANRDIADFLKTLRSMPTPSYSGNRIPEYEGEIIYAAVEGLKNEEASDISGVATALLSCAGSPSDAYVGRVRDNGQLLFFTNNIYGDRELVLEVSRSQIGGHISLLDKFAHPEPGEIEPLILSKAISSSLIDRKAALTSPVPADTLLTFLERRQDGLLKSLSHKRYHLDDYNRFGTFRETIVEILQELSLKTSDLGLSLVLTAIDGTGKKAFKDNLLVMLDGVIITDLSLLDKMDAMLIEDVDIYMDSFAMGTVAFDGAVNFITGKNYVKALSFADRVRITDFKGVSYPVAYTGGFDAKSGTDYRQLLYWHPMVAIKEGETIRIPITLPDDSGTIRVFTEGIAEGTPLRAVMLF